MGKKKELMSSAPWRGDDDDESDMFQDAKMKMTRQPGSDPTMHTHRKKAPKPGAEYEEDEPVIDPELRYSFQRNMQFLGRVFTVDTMVKPLPPAVGYNVARNINYFFRIFTQFWDEEGITNAQKSLGLGQDDRNREVR